jgi:tRNA pseudouridine38-40 synthase
MFRYKLTIEYDGTPFVGWQRQANGESVQGAVERAIERISGERRVVHAAGRTDAGVHARGQVAHVDIGREWRSDRLRDALNAHLKPMPIAIIMAEPAPPDFEARFSAIARHYLYRILNRRPRPTLEREHVWHVARRLDSAAMHAAAQCLVGRHDFSTFRAAECQANSPIRTLDRLDVSRADDVVEIHASARSFLHHQVRSMVGSLEHVGSGKWRLADIEAARDARNRSRCGMVAPARGLFLMRVDY